MIGIVGPADSMTHQSRNRHLTISLAGKTLCAARRKVRNGDVFPGSDLLGIMIVPPAPKYPQVMTSHSRK